MFLLAGGAVSAGFGLFQLALQGHKGVELVDRKTEAILTFGYGLLDGYVLLSLKFEEGG